MYGKIKPQQCVCFAFEWGQIAAIFFFSWGGKKKKVFESWKKASHRYGAGFNVDVFLSKKQCLAIRELVDKYIKKELLCAQ